jgi:type VI secretion system protein ImpG
MLSGRQQAVGARSSYVGSEVFLSLVDRSEGPFAHDLKQLAVGTLCSNRDLPLHMPIGQGVTDFNLESSAPVRSVRCVAGPTAPRQSFAHGDVTWRLISHLSLNYLSIAGENARDGVTVRELLSLYADLGDVAIRKQIDGIVGVATKPITRRLPIDGPMTFGRGLEISLAVNEVTFQGAGAYLLGAVLNRFFSKYVTLNSFVETVLTSVQRGEVARWPTQLGLRHVI